MAKDTESAFRSLPSVDRLLAHESLREAVDVYSHEVVADLARERLADARRHIQGGGAPPAIDELAAAILTSARSDFEPTLRPVINATGVLIHTNLGRAPLSKEATAAAQRAAAGYTNLELDLGSGERGSRHAHLESLLRRLTGAEAGLAVNNNASAVMLGLNAVAHGREVIVSRGEVVEIGGGFRIPDILTQSGATLVEVGTTNRTYLADFEAAVTEQTAAFLRVHRSNFQVTGFTHEPALEEMTPASAKHRVALLHDVGSGCLLETRAFGMAHEPTPQESVAAGADLVFFSGDKLLGGPQAGIIVGKERYIKEIKAHPLVRALRIDKVTMATLQVTLLHYARGEAVRKIPIWRMIAAQEQTLERRARRWARAVGEGARVIDGRSTVGGGSLPGQDLPSRVLAIEGAGQMLQTLARRLRGESPAVVARIEKESLILDPRTVAPEDDRTVVQALQHALAQT